MESVPYRDNSRYTMPPPPPPLLSQPSKRFISLEQTNLSASNNFGKFSSEPQISTPPPPIIGPQDLRRGEDTYRRYSSASDNKAKPRDHRETHSVASEEAIGPVRTSRKRQAEKDFHDPDSANSGLPKELLKMFGALKCELCCVEVNSTLQAQMHYSGKQHEKKVNSYLQTHGMASGESVPKKFSSTQAQKQTLESSYCNVCNIVLTSVAHTIQHQLGRNHKRALANLAFENSIKEEELCPVDDPTGRFGIGLGFHPRDNPDVLGLKSEEPDSTSKSRKLFCNLCKVAATCRDQMIMHLKGARHRKAENARKLKASADDVPSHTGSLLATVTQNYEGTQATALNKDYSIYRTPSGYYYCQPCNLTVNSEAQFIQHTQSKKHTKKTQQ